MKTQVAADYKKLSDEELIHRYVHKQDEYAVNVIFERYGHLVFGICAKYIKREEAAKNATEQIFKKMLQEAPTKHISNLRQWLYELTREHCTVNFGKGAISITTSLVGGITLRPSHSPEQVEQAFQRLSPDERKFMEMFYDRRLTYAQISKNTGMPVQEVKKHLHTALGKVANALELAEEERI